MLTIRSKNLSFSIGEDASGAAFSAERVSVFENADFWRLILDDGARTEMPVFSHAQTGAAKMEGRKLVITYPSLVTAYGDRYDVTFTVTVEERDGLLSFTSKVENRADLRVNECFCPLADFTELGGDKAEDTIYMPNGLGTRTKNPWQTLEALTTKYYVHDQNETFWHLPYPRATMAWFGIQSADRFLYVAKYDERANRCFMTVRHRIHSNPSDLMVGFDHFPMARKGETVETAPVVIGLFDGDWREGAKTYRAWADKTFFKVTKKADWVKNMAGWQRVIMRSQYGEDYYRAEDLPKLYLDGARHSIDTIFLFAWWKQGMDRNYPEYDEPYEGAYKALAENIKKVQALGGHVILECNAHFMDPKTDYYKKNGAEVAILDINGNEVRPGFVYPGYGEFRVTYGSVKFPLCCFGSEMWREQVLAQIRQLAEFGADCAFADCIGGCPTEPCFNEKHDHKNRPDEEWIHRKKFFSAAEKYCDKRGTVFATEVVTDVAAAHSQFIHGLVNVDFPVKGDAFPPMFRYTFPEVITTERGIRDSEGAFDRSLRISLVYGLRLDAELYVCRRSVEADPKYAAAVGAYAETLSKYRDFMIDGLFTATEDFNLPAYLRRGQYRDAEGKRLLTVTYNPTDKPVEYGGVTYAADEM